MAEPSISRGNRDKKWKRRRRKTSVLLHVEQQQQHQQQAALTLKIGRKLFFFAPAGETSAKRGNVTPPLVFFLGWFFFGNEKIAIRQTSGGEKIKLRLCLGADAIYFALGHLGK